MPTEIQTTRSIEKIKDLLEDYGCRPETSLKLAVEINELSRGDQLIADNMKGYWSNLEAGSR